MFAPPPVQLSRAEIEARLSAKRKSSIAGGPLTKARTSSSSEQDRGSLHGSASPGSPRPSHVSNAAFQISTPVTSPSRLRVEHPKSGANALRDEITREPDALYDSFGERPRKAPVPPKRSTAPPEAWFTQTRPSARPPPQGPVPDVPSEPPPLIPAKSPKRKKRARPTSAILRSLQEDPFNGGATLTGLGLKTSTTETVADADAVRPLQPLRVQTAPATMTMATPGGPTKESRKRAASARSRVFGLSETDHRASTAVKVNPRLSGVRGSRIDKASKRLSSESFARAALLDLDELYAFARPKTPPRKTSEGEVNARSSSLPDIQLPWRKQRKGETMSMLLDSGFFPLGGLPGLIHQDVSQIINVPPPIALFSKDLPPTPTSIIATPTELYQKGAPRPMRPITTRKQVNKRRSPLANGTAAKTKPSKSVLKDSLSPLRLSAIPENVPSSESTPPPSSGASTPVATQIHLRGGSVVTVSPPELTAWQRSCYIQGPIKLPKPVIVPRKNSVASLEPFQDAIDQVYQEALYIPRRRSDEQVVDDVCEFFDDFGFDEIGFDGDLLAVEDTQEGAIREADENTDDGIERFSTPRVEPEITPVEKVVAQEVVELLAKPLPSPIPAVEDQESLRARGIARLSQRAAAKAGRSSHGRKDSVTLDKPGSLHFLPVVEEAGSDAVPEAFRTEHQIVVKEPSTARNLIEIQEMDSSTSWTMAGTGPSLRSCSVKAE